MKKLILFLLTATLLILPLSSCFADNKPNEGTTPNNTTENTTPEGTTPNIPTITIPPEGNQNHPPVVEGEVDKDSKLIVTLVECLDKYWAHIDPFPKSFENQINEIKNGTQPLFVAFNPEDYYFACAYYNPTHENSESSYCCAAEYTWVRYKNESDILEYYNGMKFVAAFQMNRASTVVNILTNDTSTDIEHYSIYKPIFENGVNTAPYDASVFELWFNRAYIYLDDSDSNVIYHSKSKYNHRNLSIPCDYIDDKYFIVIELDAVNAGETPNVQEILSNNYFVFIFGEYYDTIIDVMDVEKHRTIDQHGRTIVYGLITFEDFVNDVLK